MNSVKNYLFAGNIVFVFFLIVFSNLGFLPFSELGNFIFLFLLALAFALYRPRWSFFFFVGVIMLENINLIPSDVGLNVRPYQLCGIALSLAIFVRVVSKRWEIKFPRIQAIDWAVIVFIVGSFISSVGAVNREIALKQSVIVLSFSILYFLTRIFISKFDDFKKIIPFFLSSVVVVTLYGIWQNMMFLGGGSHFEVMPGRPNATFTEPDWLGMFLVFVLALMYALSYKRISQNFRNKWQCFECAALFVLVNVLLIIAVSRSAWLGAGVVTITYFFVALYFVLKKSVDMKKFLGYFSAVGMLIILSVAIVAFGGLTNFELQNRAQSTGSGLQEITIACEKNVTVPGEIGDVSELEDYGCRHINLEEIESEKSVGKFIGKVYRKDPNVNIRAEIYWKSWEEIKKHPIIGIGWGNISDILGKDERGAGLNSSNIFLEVWLGSGVLGLVSIVCLLGYGLRKGILILMREDDSAMGLFLVLGVVAIIVPNLFNAGIMLGFVWMFFGLFGVDNEK
ncbi:O-antigen ligase family protein [Patescibacteria group bacterium]